jgi:hypothetical protein
MVRAAHGAEWTDATALGVGNCVRSWARLCGIQTQRRKSNAPASALREIRKRAPRAQRRLLVASVAVIHMRRTLSRVGSERPSNRYYAELERRLRSLAPVAREALPPETVKWFSEYLDVGEYGLAVEVAAEALVADDEHHCELARGLLAEAEIMGLSPDVISRIRAATH